MIPIQPDSLGDSGPQDPFALSVGAVQTGVRPHFPVGSDPGLVVEGELVLGPGSGVFGEFGGGDERAYAYAQQS